MAITQERLKQIFNYHEDGYFIWKIKHPHGSNKVGLRAGYLDTCQVEHRYRVMVDQKLYQVSRLVFLFHKGYLPVEVDHRDRDSTNDRIENLREASRTQNCKNISSRPSSSSKYLGVSFHKKHKKWESSIRANGKPTYLGSFKTEKEAAIAYNKMAQIYHGEFANLNVITD